MRFDDLDKRLRQYETAYDFCVPQENFIVVRLDGRGFTRLTKEIWQFEAPFDIRFRDLMVHTVRHLMKCGFNVAYGYSESDEISLLLRRDDDTFKRKTRKIISVLAGEASAALPFLWRTGNLLLLMHGFAFCRTKNWWSIISVGDTKTHTATRSTPTAIGCCARKEKAYPEPQKRSAVSRARRNMICCLNTISISTNCPHGRNVASVCIFRRP